MPRKFTHVTVGEIISLPLLGVAYSFFTSDFNYWMFAIVVTVGFLCILFGSLFPDLIERPINADHRKFLHSWFMFAVTFILSFVTGFVLIPLYDHLFFVYPLFGFMLGYFTHLLLDSTTKRSLT